MKGRSGNATSSGDGDAEGADVATALGVAVAEATLGEAVAEERASPPQEARTSAQTSEAPTGIFMGKGCSEHDVIA